MWEKKHENESVEREIIETGIYAELDNSCRILWYYVSRRTVFCLFWSTSGFVIIEERKDVRGKEERQIETRHMEIMGVSNRRVPNSRPFLYSIKLRRDEISMWMEIYKISEFKIEVPQICRSLLFLSTSASPTRYAYPVDAQISNFSK